MKQQVMLLLLLSIYTGSYAASINTTNTGPDKTAPEQSVLPQHVQDLTQALNRVNELLLRVERDLQAHATHQTEPPE